MTRKSEGIRIMQHSGTPISGRQTTRRSIVNGGLKLAYAAPVIAASFHIDMMNISAEMRCSTPDPKGCCLLVFPFRRHYQEIGGTG